MVRPRQIKQVWFDPTVMYFKPRRVPLSKLKEVELSVEQLEAIRLSDFENHSQKECAEIMGISQPTFSRFINEARQKLAKAVVTGQAIKIQRGGDKMPAGNGTGPIGTGRGAGRGAGRAYGGPDVCKCPSCGHEQSHIRGKPCYQQKCEKCGSMMVRGN